ncbi:Alpha-1,4-glucan:maltose-1-phosphate maltosyltransferase [Streptomyces sp. RB5]|uniref:Alpha-1,4-glucan:maltose-1-phosphate maltosyltransferase n=1 Tax=Streptomyces smaragdinus TaxID=2585196 RepID=A0A7K0CF32_9ACTN|nr:Alpha-1,4-glucan:maltose-1-phosphate maltosyltransferase [Streptomyces smaragdinus]
MSAQTGRIPVLDVRPRVDCGARPAKAVTGESFDVTATVFREGHEAVGANVVLVDPAGRPGPYTPMRELAPGTDRWGAEVTPTAEVRWTYRVEAWGDPLASWRRAAEIKVPAGVDPDLVLEEGALLHERAARGVPRVHRPALLAVAQALREETWPVAERLAAALDPAVVGLLARHPLREHVTASGSLPLLVERERALYGAWYKLFPRSEGAAGTTGGTLRTAAERLAGVAAMGFDVVYLPPVHPIGSAYRKGPGGSLSPGPDDPGSPWAIGSAAGGHDAVHPELGTLGDFDHFVATARTHGLEVALDFALQCSPDHPWVEKHPDWFRRRPDGSVAYAENPPKKYQDIYRSYSVSRSGCWIHSCSLRTSRTVLGVLVACFRPGSGGTDRVRGPGVRGRVSSRRRVSCPAWAVRCPCPSLRWAGGGAVRRRIRCPRARRPIATAAAS